MKIVTVDDDPVQRWLVAQSLSQAGHDVLETANGLDALRLVEREQADIVITNWLMPGLDGPALAQHIRDADVDHYVYIILLTAKDARQDVLSGLEAGVDDYLTKPFDPRELRARVEIARRILGLLNELRHARDHERMLARHDSLTGLPNRRVTHEFAEQQLQRAAAAHLPVSLLLLDIDDFKHVNSAHGYVIGDQALYLIAATITDCKRSTDWLGRWGSEEFLMILPDTALDQALALAETIRLAVSNARLLLPGGGHLTRTMSLGVTTVEPGSHTTLDQLLHRADKALHEAKLAGRNRVRCDKPASTPLLDV